MAFSLLSDDAYKCDTILFIKSGCICYHVVIVLLLYTNETQQYKQFRKIQYMSHLLKRRLCGCVNNYTIQHNTIQRLITKDFAELRVFVMLLLYNTDTNSTLFLRTYADHVRPGKFSKKLENYPVRYVTENQSVMPHTPLPLL